MFALFIVVVGLALTVEGDLRDPTTDQITFFKNNTYDPIVVATLSNGAPVSCIVTNSSLNNPILRDSWFSESISVLVQEKTPERLVHVKDIGAFGYFEVTNDVSHIFNASFMKIGKTTPVATLLSTSALLGSSGLFLDERSFAVNFYTDEGNFDIVRFNTPVYLFKDPLLFHLIGHVSRRNPTIDVFDPNMLWDMFTAAPKTSYMAVFLFSGLGIPSSNQKTSQKMSCFKFHTYQNANGNGDTPFCRFFLQPSPGVKNMSPKQASMINTEQPDFLNLVLHRDISNGDFPSWNVSVQMVTDSDIKKIGPSVFDVTRTLPINNSPATPFGKLVFNRNAKNFYEAEQFYGKEMTSEEQTQVVENISASLKYVVPSIPQKAEGMLASINNGLSYRIAEIIELLSDLT